MYRLDYLHVLIDNLIELLVCKLTSLTCLPRCMYVEHIISWCLQNLFFFNCFDIKLLTVNFLLVYSILYWKWRSTFVFRCKFTLCIYITDLVRSLSWLTLEAILLRKCSLKLWKLTMILNSVYKLWKSHIRTFKLHGASCLNI